MHDYLEEKKPAWSIQNLQVLENKAKDDKIKDFRRFAEKMIWLKFGALPPAAYFWSQFQQQVLHLRISHIVDAHQCLKQIQKLPAFIKYSKAQGKSNRF